MSGPETIHVLPTETYFAMIRRELADEGRAYVRVTGRSMMPLLRHLKDGVIIQPPGELRPGDIVLFDRRNGRFALHRVIRVAGEHFDMAGDNQWHVEYGLPAEQVMGTAVCILRGSRMIPCKNFFVRLYARAVTCLTEPRIKMRRAVGRLVKPFRRAGSDHRKGKRG